MYAGKEKWINNKDFQNTHYTGVEIFVKFSVIAKTA